jgi:dinuclear metal center YbgI/SA1388 family protein
MHQGIRDQGLSARRPCAAADSLPTVPTFADLIRVLDGLYPFASAEDWDAVGPVCGDPAAEVRTVLLAIDPVEKVVEEAFALAADVLVTHHPVFLRGTSTVWAGTPKGRLVHRLITGGCGLVVAHTNADIAVGGVSQALADALGLTGTDPLVPTGDGRTGSGRVGDLVGPMTLAEFAGLVARSLPATPAGVRTAGDPGRMISRVAVCGGAGDAYLEDAARSGADAYVTADLRHHYASEHLAAGGPAIVDPGHWASEWPWLPVAARALADGLAADRPGDATVSVHVSERITDPWTLHEGPGPQLRGSDS